MGGEAHYPQMAGLLLRLPQYIFCLKESCRARKTSQKQFSNSTFLRVAGKVNLTNLFLF
jgi:hypothetical protein